MLQHLEKICGNSIDYDGDGLVDITDSDCHLDLRRNISPMLT
jgi:hypothetical protein